MKAKISQGFLLLAMLALAGCPPSKHAQTPAKTANPSIAAQPEDNIDLAAFLGRLRKAVHAHDVNAVAAMMTTDFGYRLNPVGAGEGVFEYWDQNNLWPELDAIISEKFVPKENFMVAPPQFVDPNSHYDGYRAGICRINGSWKFAYFVNG